MQTLKQIFELNTICKTWQYKPFDSAPVQILDIGGLFFVKVRDCESNEWLELKAKRGTDGARAHPTLQAAYDVVRGGIKWEGVIELVKIQCV